jgi:hypothetical protein
MPHSLKASCAKSLRFGQSGQVVIEYVLLMVLMAGIGAFIVRNFVSRNVEEPGILVAKWNQILEVIATDNPED